MADAMAAMRWLFASGHAVDLVIAVIALELGWLIRRGGWRTTDALLRLGPGVLMLIALRAALTGSAWYWIALPLALSFPINVADLAQHPRRATRPGD